MSTTRKHRNFVNEPIKGKRVTELPGVGEALGKRLKNAGYDKAADVLKIFKSFNGDQKQFQKWMNDTCEARPIFSAVCHKVLTDWCDKYTLSDTEDDESHAEDSLTNTQQHKRKTANNSNEPPRKNQKIVQNGPFGIIKRHHDEENIDSCILKMIIYDLQPFSIVNDAGFRLYSKALNPKYKVPDQKTLFAGLLPKVYEMRLKEMKTLVRDNAKSICVTVDYWKSCTLNNYMGLTAHFITEDHVELKSVLLECCEIEGEYNGNSTYQKVKEIAEKWDIHYKINSVVIDNTPQMKDAVSYFDSEGWFHIVCFARILNVIVQKALDEIKDLISKVQKIVKYILQNTTAEEELIEYQINQQNNTEPKTVIESIPSRWITVYLMIKRFVELKEPVQTVISNFEIDIPKISTDEWKCIEQICNILTPFYQTIEEMREDKYLVASKILLFTWSLKNNCNRLSDVNPAVTTFANKLKDDITKELKHIETNDTFGMCAILDPRFKLIGIHDNAKIETLKNKIRLEINETNFVNENNSEQTESTSTADPISSTHSDLFAFDLWSKFDKENKSQNELDKYLTETNIKRTECPFQYWEKNKSTHPSLFKLFIKYCNIMVTSVPYEQILSESGYITEHRRTQLSTAKLPEIMFLNANKM